MRQHRFTSWIVAGGIMAGGWLGGSADSVAGEVSEPAAFPPVPNPAQWAWHQAELRMFVHFGMKTFHPSNVHLGTGREDPKTFNPRRFDADQWVAAAKAGGFEGIVLTTKHHDGFCNWATDTTDFCVKSSPWKGGKGDVVRELIEACRRGGLSFGLYVSIIDKHFEQFGAPGFKTYNDFYLAQLRELSTRYGRIDEYWFDGFKSDQTKIDYEKLAGLLREKQPDAVIYDSGTLVKYLPDRCLAWPGHHGGLKPDQTYRQKVEGKMCWYPCEPSTILQGNWFHNGKPMISLRAIEDQYLTTVGYGVTPLMNVSPNQDGLIDEASVKRLKQFKAWADQLHARDLARRPGVKIRAKSVRGNAPKYGPEMAIDGDEATYYATDDGVTDAVLEIDFGKVREIDGFILKEFIPLGQRVNGYGIDCWKDGKWSEIFSGKTIGYQRIILEGRASAKNVSFPATDRVRLRIDGALACPLISAFQVIGSDR
jgi:alpha-L-fucosidase